MNINEFSRKCEIDGSPFKAHGTQNRLLILCHLTSGEITPGELSRLSFFRKQHFRPLSQYFERIN